MQLLPHGEEATVSAMEEKSSRSDARQVAVVSTGRSSSEVGRSHRPRLITWLH